MSGSLRLAFLKFRHEDFRRFCAGLHSQSKRRVRLRPFNRFAAELTKQTRSLGLNLDFSVSREECEVPLTEGCSVIGEDQQVDATFVFAPNGSSLASILMEYLDLESGCVVAPVTDGYFNNKPLFLISIPKSGTHLLMELVHAFGYRAGVVCPDDPAPGFWYCVEYSNTHTSARDFFVDTVRRSHFGNRAHPFLKSPGIFIYRNPLDIVVSEANYYHRDGKAAFYSYLCNLSFEERLLKLIHDPWMLGSILDRVGNFVAWLEIRNVIPISFEELVGPQGGGDKEVQKRLLWSLQLKLQIPGDPEEFGQRIYNQHSPTFGEGRVGAYKKYFTQEAKERFCSLPQDAMRQFGYEFEDSVDTFFLPRRASEFRRRPLRFSEAGFNESPIAVEYRYHGCNVVLHHGRYHIIPRCLGHVDLADPNGLGLLKIFIATFETLADARDALLLNRAFYHPLFWKLLGARIWAASRQVRELCRFREHDA